jgi:hypothetical protein
MVENYFKKNDLESSEKFPHDSGKQEAQGSSVLGLPRLKDHFVWNIYSLLKGPLRR